MKKYFIGFLVSLFLIQGNTQSPDKVSYQAVVRDGNNSLISNSNVGVEVNIYQGSATGTVVYTEEHTVTSNDNGLITLEIGQGTAVNGDFSTIDWGDGPYFLGTGIDPTGGTNYSITTVSQMMSVPYALYSKESGKGIEEVIDNGDGTLTFNYFDGSSYTTGVLSGLTGPQGPAGNDGVGISSTVDNGDGTFTLNYTDGSSFTTSDLTGPQGAQGPQGNQGPAGNDGVGITSTVDNGDGTFTFTYSDGSTFTTSDLTGPAGTYTAGNGIQINNNVISTSVEVKTYTTTVSTSNDWTTQNTCVYLNLPNKKILGVYVNSNKQGIRYNITEGYTNWGIITGLWNNVSYSGTVNEYVKDSGVPNTSSSNRWPWVVISCVNGSGSGQSFDIPLVITYID